MDEDYPSYLKLHRSGELQERAQKARTYLSPCRVCPRGCLMDRLAGEKGKCNVGRDALLASYGPHFGEEAVLRGSCGSGTVFFAGCNLQCVYCQNYDISHMHHGRPVSAEGLAQVFLEIQAEGCHNLNLVTPTHVVPQILDALALAAKGGFRLPLVYNTSGYDSPIMLHLLDGVVDIYMPDLKYADDDIGLKYSGIHAYNRVARRATKEMHRQVGVLALDERGIAKRGVLIRHLVLPGNLAGTREVMEFIATELSPDSYVNVMGQYRPEYRAFQYGQVARYPTGEELAQAVRWALDAGIHRGIPFGP